MASMIVSLSDLADMACSSHTDCLPYSTKRDLCPKFATHPVAWKNAEDYELRNCKMRHAAIRRRLRSDTKKRFSRELALLTLALLVLARLVARAYDAPKPANAPADPAVLFARKNLTAWCVVPFDAKKRGPEER